MAVSAAQSVLGTPPMATNSRGVAAQLASFVVQRADSDALEGLPAVQVGDLHVVLHLHVGGAEDGRERLGAQTFRGGVHGRRQASRTRTVDRDVVLPPLGLGDKAESVGNIPQS